MASGDSDKKKKKSFIESHVPTYKVKIPNLNSFMKLICFNVKDFTQIRKINNSLKFLQIFLREETNLLIIL